MKAVWVLCILLLLGVGGYAAVRHANPPQLSPEEALSYARSLAQYEPLLALAGTDPEALRRAASALEETQSALAALQTDADDAALIRSSLYPVALLRSLAETEEARMLFVASGTAEHASRYDSALADTIPALQESLELFKQGFAAAVPPDAPSYQVLAGTVSRESTLRAIADMQQRAEDLSQELIRRRECAQAYTRACAPKELDALLPASLPTAGPAELPSLTEEVLGIRAEVIGDPALRELPVVALHASACLAGLPAPHYLLIREESSGPLAPPLDFVGDIVLYPVSTSSEGPVIRYLSERGASSYPPSPVAFYQCPNIGSDVGRAFSTLRVYERLGNPGASPISESEAANLLRDALQEGGAEFSELALMVENRSARFDALVSEVAAFGRNDAQVKKAGIPIDTSALYYFYVKSGFPSLYLGYNLSVTGNRGISVFENTDAEQLWERLTLWSDIRSSMSREELVRNMRVFFTMHDNPQASLRSEVR